MGNEVKKQAEKYAKDSLKIYSNLNFSYDTVVDLMTKAYEKGWNDKEKPQFEIEWEQPYL